MKTVFGAFCAQAFRMSLFLAVLSVNLAAQTNFQTRLTPQPSDIGVSGVDVNPNRYMVLQQLQVTTSNHDLLMTRLTGTGALVVPSMRIGSGAQDYPHYVQKTFNTTNVHDGYIAVGETTYGYTGANPRTDLFLIRTDTFGNVVWSRRFGMVNSNEYGFNVVQTPDRGFLAVGYSQVPGSISHAYAVRTDAAGNALWNRTYNFGASARLNFADIRPTATTTGLYVVGRVHPTFANEDVLMMHLNPQTGAVIWANRYYHQSNNGLRESGLSIRFAQNYSQLVVAGTAGTDGFAFKTNQGGTIVWGFRYVSPGENISPVGIVRGDAAGNDLVIGGTMRNGAGARRAFLQRLNSGGATLAIRTYDYNSPTIGLADVRQTNTNGFMGIGSIANLTDSYVLRANSTLATTSACLPQTPVVTSAIGVFSAPVSAQIVGMESFAYPVTASPYTIQQKLCSGSALDAGDDREAESETEIESAAGSSSLRVFPNPVSSGQNSVRAEIVSDGSGSPLHVQISDLAGRSLVQFDVDENPGGVYEIETAGLAEGLYFMTVAQRGVVLGTSRLAKVK